MTHPAIPAPAHRRTLVGVPTPAPTRTGWTRLYPQPALPFHVVVLDGVFSEDDDGGVTFHEATHLSDDDMQRLDIGLDADPGFDIDHTPTYDLTEPEPVPDFDFDQSAGA